MNGKRRMAWLLILLMVATAPAAGEKKQAAVKTKQMLMTWLCAGEEAPVREKPNEKASVLWTMRTDRLYRTDQHVDQYYQLTDDNGMTGYVSKGAVRICNAYGLDAGTMFKLPHVAPKIPRLPVKPVMAYAGIAGESARIFLAKEEREEDLSKGERVYVFASYGDYAAVWHRGRLGYIRGDQIVLCREGNDQEFFRTQTGTVTGSLALDQAFSMLEEANPIARRYEKITGRKIETLFSAGVPYFWGGQSEKILLERWPEYSTRKQWQGSNDYYQKDVVYVYGLDCVGFVKTVYERAGSPLKESLKELGEKRWCRAGDHLFCSRARPFPADWEELAKKLLPGDVLVLHHPGMHAMIYIGTLRSYGYTEEQLPYLADYLDYPLMIHSGENPQVYQRFACLTIRSEDSRVTKAEGADGGVSLCILGVPREAAEAEVACLEKTYGCFDAEGACITIFNFSNVSDYYVYRP